MNSQLDFINELTKFQLGAESNEDNCYFIQVSAGLFDYLNNYVQIKEIDKHVLKYTTVYGHAYFYKTKS